MIIWRFNEDAHNIFLKDKLFGWFGCTAKKKNILFLFLVQSASHRCTLKMYKRKMASTYSGLENNEASFIHSNFRVQPSSPVSCDTHFAYIDTTLSRKYWNFVLDTMHDLYKVHNVSARTCMLLLKYCTRLDKKRNLPQGQAQARVRSWNLPWPLAEPRLDSTIERKKGNKLLQISTKSTKG